MSYHKLSFDKIKLTLNTLSNRISARFPESSLLTLSKELTTTLDKIKNTIEILKKPDIKARIFFYCFCLILVVFFAFGIIKLCDSIKNENEVNAYIQSMEAMMNTFLLIGGAIYFMYKYEERKKEKIILRKIKDLRIYIHVIDMHQMSKDPLSISSLSTQYSNKEMLTDYEMNRYLNYCCELLAITSKMAVLFANENTTERVSEAVHEIEMLSATLNRKIWQKIALIGGIANS